MPSSSDDAYSSATVITSSLAAFVTGFALGLYSIRGYLIPPSLWSLRAENLAAPAESDESEIDEDDSILDHAPNWANGAEADRKQGLRARKSQKGLKDAAEKETETETTPKATEKTNVRKEAEAAHPRQAVVDVNASGKPNEECKLVLVVRTDLGMTKGKIAAQCSHATLACYKTLSKLSSTSAPAKNVLNRWERLGQAKVALKANSEDELLTLMGIARSLGVTAEVIQDAGRTQIDPGSITVLGVGPAPKSLVDQVTGSLKLL